MSEITISNTDWSIVDAVRTALVDARVAGEAVFASVDLATSLEHMRQVQLSGPTPRAVILYKNTQEHVDVDGGRACWVSLELILSTRIAAVSDASGRIQEILRLKNAAVNAIETDRPSEATGAASADVYRPGLLWNPADIKFSEPGVDPWVLCRLGLEITYALQSPAAH